MIIDMGFHEENGTFGTFRKGCYMAQSNFQFVFISEVVCHSHPQTSGFVISVTEEGSVSST